MGRSGANPDLPVVVKLNFRIDQQIEKINAPALK